jgi:hypothetical protein
MFSPSIASHKIALGPGPAPSLGIVGRGAAGWGAAGWALLMLGLASCGTGYPIGSEHARPIVRGDAERDLECPAEDIRVEEEWGGVWEAVGCGKKMRYKANCDSIRCEVHREDQPPVPFKDRPEPQDVPR